MEQLSSLAAAQKLRYVAPSSSLIDPPRGLDRGRGHARGGRSKLAMVRSGGGAHLRLPRSAGADKDAVRRRHSRPAFSVPALSLAARGFPATPRPTSDHRGPPGVDQGRAVAAGRAVRRPLRGRRQGRLKTRTLLVCLVGIDDAAIALAQLPSLTSLGSIGGSGWE